MIIAFTSFSQVKVELSTENTEKGYAIFASNDEYCPVSVELKFKLTNLTLSTGEQLIFVIPSKTKKFLIANLEKIDADKRYTFSTKTKANYGDIALDKYDTAFVYDLPFSKGNNFIVYQGYNGSFSHKNENALDFTMPEGSNIVAARDGIVISVVQDNTEFCPNKSCIQYNNYINIYHNDGSFANYSHIKYNGSKVNIGDSVKQGDVIALSGNTGFTSGPHLHFVCYLPGLEQRKTFETYFKINDGNEVIKLQEKETYFKNY
jgi:murein DD-endopeptidase MepM/ murein hydrolase activator NlpD